LAYSNIGQGIDGIPALEPPLAVAFHG